MAHAAPHAADQQPDRRDGALRCRLCGDATPALDHEWCHAAVALVCDDCCRALLAGNVMRLVDASHATGEPLTHRDVIVACLECPRVERLVAEHALDDEDGTVH